ncbi:hypothetical protein Pcinc_042263 [Petrolisthes cinctipes]|uniref:Uncharacterized protein n=1 Tax=Petrolisthes cinctipes TaxID=88211 RepID=A0AAE1BI81_PETCI|nr:hypothetical protein Pcinc_042263 [Petrolisthes cinctipes]
MPILILGPINLTNALHSHHRVPITLTPMPIVALGSITPTPMPITALGPINLTPMPITALGPIFTPSMSITHSTGLQPHTMLITALGPITTPSMSITHSTGPHHTPLGPSTILM